MFRPTDASAALNRPGSGGKPKLALFFSAYCRTTGSLPSYFLGSGAISLIPKRCLGKLVVLAFAAAAASAGAADRIAAVRVWPAQDYTRITIEADRPLRHELLLVKNPDRLVLDLDGVDFASVQREIADKILPGDPYIGQMRAGRYKPGVVRLVLDLKTEVRPQIFTLKPVGEYGHRLVLDVYPLIAVDPLMALLQKPELKADAGGPGAESAQETPRPEARSGPARGPGQAAKRKPVVARLVTIVIDAGHGGEDPGATGRRGSREKHVTLTIAGNRRIPYEEAEMLKRTAAGPELQAIALPVFEKMTDIVHSHIKTYDVPAIYLTGGTCCFPGVVELFRREFPDKEIILPSEPLYLTPLAIASYGI